MGKIIIIAIIAAALVAGAQSACDTTKGQTCTTTYTTGSTDLIKANNPAEFCDGYKKLTTTFITCNKDAGCLTKEETDKLVAACETQFGKEKFALGTLNCTFTCAQLYSSATTAAVNGALLLLVVLMGLLNM